MKKTVLTVAAIGFTFAGFAQDKLVTSAATALSQRNLEEAKADIDKAIANPETSSKPKALYVKAQVYFSLAQEAKYASLKPVREATLSLMKLAEVKPDYEKEEVTNNLFIGACDMYNEGNADFNDADKSKPADKKLSDAMESYKTVIKIHDLGGGKRFEKYQRKLNFDTIAANALVNMSRIAYYQKNQEEIISILTKVNVNPITKAADNYIILLETYDKYNTANANKMGAAEMQSIADARKAFPNDINIRNMEMNAYLKNGKMAELVKKMEEAVAAEPNNADLNFNLALLYQGQANPKEGGKPANSAELYKKSEDCFKKAVGASSENGNYLYNFGALYFMQGYDVNDQMNAIKGTSPDELKKYEALKKQRDAYFESAKAQMEKAATLLGTGTVKESDKDVYTATLEALKQLYQVADNKAKVDEINGKLKALKAQDKQ